MPKTRVRILSFRKVIEPRLPYRRPLEISGLCALGVLVSAFAIVLSVPIASPAEPGPFGVPEPAVQPAAAAPHALKLAKGETVIDLDVSPLGSVSAAIIQGAGGAQKIAFWNMRSDDTSEKAALWAVPAGNRLFAVAFHPLGHQLFFLNSVQGEYRLISSPVTEWRPSVLYRSPAPLRRLVPGPRPFAISYDEKADDWVLAYRLFFGVAAGHDLYVTRSITVDGKKEYTVLGPVNAKAKGKDSLNAEASDSESPQTIDASSALPVGFHPAGHRLLWEDSGHCFNRARYGMTNWEGSSALAGSNELCGGSVTYTPNGLALIRWMPNVPGVTLLYNAGVSPARVAEDVTFTGTPSSVPDGKGLVGVTAGPEGAAIQYVPISVPLSDVVNAWMFIESPSDHELLSKHNGLFRPLDSDQLYGLYDTENYSCGGYDESTPTRPYLVTTDVFWEQYAAAFEGIFVLAERTAAVPAFWSFVGKADQALGGTSSKMARAFRVLTLLKSGAQSNDPEVKAIVAADGEHESTVTGKTYDYAALKPRGHYVADESLETYFRASSYILHLELDDSDRQELEKLPAEVHEAARKWIAAYEPFTAPSRRPVIWKTESRGVPAWVSHPDEHPGLFPLSWGIDNEILWNAVFHEALPQHDQITGPEGPRLLPSGLDLPAALGSRAALSFLEQSGEFSKYPPLKAKLEELARRFDTLVGRNVEEPEPDLYQQWLSGLAVQWSDQAASQAGDLATDLWRAKRVQTGLASWATLRHATVLVNERAVAECGEGGFEKIILRSPRGYVEPDPDTFDRIAKLFDSTIAFVALHGSQWEGDTPCEDCYEEQPQKLFDGVTRRLKESRDKVRLFRDIAAKEVRGEPLTGAEYEEILYVGRAAEHNFLIFKSLAKRDLALSNPDPLPKIADVASSGDGKLLLAAVGYPLEWNQVVPFFGRKELVKGPAYSYYELSSTRPKTDAEWRELAKAAARPPWISPYMAGTTLSCPPKAE